jgi:hypothetical protein
MNCINCSRPLNESQYKTSGGIEYKSCPNCSTSNEKEHVYYKYPQRFGETTTRSSATHPSGPQSYCAPCRGRGNTLGSGELCSEL